MKKHKFFSLPILAMGFILSTYATIAMAIANYILENVNCEYTPTLTMKNENSEQAKELKEFFPNLPTPDVPNHFNWSFIYKLTDNKGAIAPIITPILVDHKIITTFIDIKQADSDITLKENHIYAQRSNENGNIFIKKFERSNSNQNYAYYLDVEKSLDGEDIYTILLKVMVKNGQFNQYISEEMHCNRHVYKGSLEYVKLLQHKFTRCSWDDLLYPPKQGTCSLM
ncbi:MAG: hypothetical protein K0R14_1411 [Burkholderiales bacterium]|jgi:hypothetical protein|nr:hypothetical protein [Burkholderiales bacterium]